MRLPGQNLYNGRNLAALLAQMPDTNNGSHAGGLGSVLMKAMQGYQMGKEMQADEDARAVMKQAGEAMMGKPAVPDAPGPTMGGEAGYTIPGKAGDRNLAASLLMGNDRTAGYGMQMVQEDQRLAAERARWEMEQANADKRAGLVKIRNPSDGKGMYVKPWEAEGAEPWNDSVPQTVTTAEGVYERDPQSPTGLGRRLGGPAASLTMPQWVPGQGANGPVLRNERTGEVRPDPTAPQPPSGYRVKADGSGFEPIPGGPADPARPGAKPSFPEYAAKNAGYAARMIESEKNIKKLLAGEKDAQGNWVRSPYDPGNVQDRLARSLPDMVESAAMSAEGQQYTQAMRDWTRAKLRRESGAAIGKDEEANEYKTYWPMPGEDPASLAQKEAQRRLAAEGLMRESQGAYEAFYGGGGQPRPAQAQPASGPRPGDVMDGFRYVGGNPADPASWEPAR